MPIQWFPGHMHSTRQALAKRLPDIDVVIELLDARLPGSSANPLLAQLAAGKPALKILNKQDLADPDTTALWVAHLEAQSQTRAMPLDAGATGVGQRLVAACRALVPHRGGMVKPVRVLVCGIPNVGKSTLVNSLLGKRRAKTGDEAGITKTEQRIALAADFDLFDTPGMLWPKIGVDASGYHLAASGAVGRNAYDDVEVALHLLGRVRPRYDDRLLARYKLRDAAALAGLDDEALLTEVGRKRGGLLAGGLVNLQKAAEAVIHDFRSSAWGRVSLETPDEYTAWAAAAAAAEAAKAERAAAQAAAKAAARSGRRAASSGSAPSDADTEAPSDPDASGVDDAAV